MDLPHVLKLGKGPEHGHVNCSLFIPKNSRGASDQNHNVFKITFKKCPICPMSTSLICNCQWQGV